MFFGFSFPNWYLQQIPLTHIHTDLPTIDFSPPAKARNCTAPCSWHQLDKRKPVVYYYHYLYNYYFLWLSVACRLSTRNIDSRFTLLLRDWLRAALFQDSAAYRASHHWGRESNDHWGQGRSSVSSSWVIFSYSSRVCYRGY